MKPREINIYKDAEQVLISIGLYPEL